ncbi:MAG: histidine phosphatase family protein [Planctomycetota bacterium]
MDTPLTPLDFAPRAPEPPRAPRRLSGGTAGRVWLLRHGAVDSSQGTYGNRDVPLSALGLQQTEDLAASIVRAEELRVVASSPLSRARALGEAIAQRAPDARLIVDARLAELDRGDWQGLPHAEYQERWRAEGAAWWRDPLHWRGHGGETEADLADRGVRAVEDALLAAGGGTLVVTAHRQLVRATVAALIGIPPGRSYAMALPVATGVLLEATEGGACRLLRTACARPDAPQAAAPADGPPLDVPTSREDVPPAGSPPMSR